MFDDGSTDSAPQLLRELCVVDQRVHVLRLSRNFGHQFATTAGLEHALGDATVIIDADLQDPPEAIPQWSLAGTKVMTWLMDYAPIGAVKQLAKLFYRFNFKRTDSPGHRRRSADGSKVVDALLLMPERDRFSRGMVSWLGHRQVAGPYRRAARFSGASKYPTHKMVRFAMDGLLSFSIAP